VRGALVTEGTTMELDHVTAIVEDLAATSRALELLLGRGPDAVTLLAGMAIHTYRLGSFELHLNAPTGEGPVMEHLRAHGPGFHHVALRCGDLDGALRALALRGLPHEGAPVETAPGLREVFLRSSEMGSLAVQLVERSALGVAHELRDDEVRALVATSVGEDDGRTR
jgi:4-hydroxyphenylpyruvate dioxygenase-like putative hemolysin